MKNTNLKNKLMDTLTKFSLDEKITTNPMYPTAKTFLIGAIAVASGAELIDILEDVQIIFKVK